MMEIGEAFQLILLFKIYETAVISIHHNIITQIINLKLKEVILNLKLEREPYHKIKQQGQLKKVNCYQIKAALNKIMKIFKKVK